VFTRGEAAALVTERAWLQAMLDFEAALARACARAGLVPPEAAEEIASACSADHFDPAALARGGASAGNPAVPLVAALRAQLPDSVAGHVHRGATSQDVIDTAAMLVARRVIAPILDDAARAGGACARLASEHRETVMLGRTLLQQAVPITFGLKAAGWLAGIERSRRELARVGEHELALQFGGAAGTVAALGDRGVAVTAELARELGLARPALPWHGERSRPARLASALAGLGGAAGKAARDVVLLAQNEVDEVRLGGSGGSSAMPHKRNPVSAVAVLACADRLPGLLATMHSSLIGEHERAVGAWHAEWETLTDMLRLTGSAVAWAAEMLESLEVDPGRMRANLEGAGDLVMAESVTAALSDKVGGREARRIVDQAVQTPSFREALVQTALLTPDELDRALSPDAYLGSAQAFIDAALAEYGAP
jgi:3-carboxy-cis,cis-muconate cycloisomerase